MRCILNYSSKLLTRPVTITCKLMYCWKRLFEPLYCSCTYSFWPIGFDSRSWEWSISVHVWVLFWFCIKPFDFCEWLFVNVILICKRSAVCVVLLMNRVLEIGFVFLIIYWGYKISHHGVHCLASGRSEVQTPL